MPGREEAQAPRKLSRVIVVAGLAFLAAVVGVASSACSSKPRTNVVSRSASATSATWAADGRVIFPEIVGNGPLTTAIKTFDPETRERGVLLTVVGQPSGLDSDSINRVLLEGLSGDWVLLREDGAILFVVTALPGVPGVPRLPRISPDGLNVAFMTPSQPPDLDVYTAADGEKVSSFAAFEASGVVRALAWTPDDLSVLYVKGDASGSAPDAIRRVLLSDSSSSVSILQDPTIPFIDRLFVSEDGSTLLFSGRDSGNHSGVWTLPSAGVGFPVKIASAKGDQLSVRAAAGPSPDGTQFVLLATTASGLRLTVEPILPEGP